MENNKADSMTVERQRILLGRIQKLSDYQSKNANLMNCYVMGGELPLEIKKKIRTPEAQAKFRARIEKAERIKFNITLLIVNDITNE